MCLPDLIFYFFPPGKLMPPEATRQSQTYSFFWGTGCSLSVKVSPEVSTSLSPPLSSILFIWHPKSEPSLILYIKWQVHLTPGFTIPPSCFIFFYSAVMSWMVFSQNLCLSQNLRMWSYLGRIQVDAIQLRWGHKDEPQFTMTGVLIRRRKFGHRHTKRTPSKMETEIGVMNVQAKEQ